MKLVQAVFGSATYYGVLAFNQTPVVVLVKAKKGDNSHLGVEVKGINSEVTEGIIEAIADLLCEQEETEE